MLTLTQPQKLTLAVPITCPSNSLALLCCSKIQKESVIPVAFVNPVLMIP